ncbi:MAG: YafY family transcriptional regulator [Hyphomicrobiales bacterium]|nr:YafY family transcriptional regulator [Hyphomicrobiales bacterium]
MRRADRLFQIVQYLRAGRLLTAKILAERLEVSERTIYRDIADLQGSGVPIDGEAGVGYLLRQGYDLPPLMFNRDEMAALVIGARIVSAWGGVKMALAAQEALVKIEAVLPRETQGSFTRTPVYAIDFQMGEKLRQRLDILDDAINQRALLDISYFDAAKDQTKRTIEPLGLYFWGKVWTLVAWCQMRDDFRSFRIDRIGELKTTDQIFPHTKGKTLTDYLAKMVHEEGINLPDSIKPGRL